jgi:hypothetical protein
VGWEGWSPSNLWLPPLEPHKAPLKIGEGRRRRWEVGGGRSIGSLSLLQFLASPLSLDMYIWVLEKEIKVMTYYSNPYGSSFGARFFTVLRYSDNF